jgi:hypothetical protein
MAPTRSDSPTKFSSSRRRAHIRIRHVDFRNPRARSVPAEITPPHAIHSQHNAIHQRSTIQKRAGPHSSANK